MDSDYYNYCLCYYYKFYCKMGSGGLRRVPLAVRSEYRYDSPARTRRRCGLARGQNWLRVCQWAVGHLNLPVTTPSRIRRGGYSASDCHWQCGCRSTTCQPGSAAGARATGTGRALAESAAGPTAKAAC